MVILILLEGLSWLFIFILHGQLCIKYLYIQGFFVVLVLISAMWSPVVVTLGLLLKIGLPPFQRWLFHFVNFMAVKSFLFIRTAHKAVPLILLGKSLSFSRGFLLNCFLLIVSRLVLYQGSQFFLVLIWSSIVHRAWTLLRFLVRKRFATTYWIIYRIIVLVLLLTSFFRKVIILVIGQGVLSMLAWLVVSGIPPFSIFWFKVNLFLVLVQLGFFISTIIVLSSVLALRVYFWAFHFSVLRICAFSNKPSFLWPSIILFSTVLIF